MIARRRDSAMRLCDDWDPHSIVIVRVGEIYMMCDPYQNNSTAEQVTSSFEVVTDLLVQQPAAECIYNPDPHFRSWETASRGLNAIESIFRLNAVTRLRWAHALHYAIQDGSTLPIRGVLDSVVEQFSNVLDIPVDLPFFLAASGIFENAALTFIGSIGDVDVSDDELDLKLRKRVRTYLSNFVADSLAKQVFWLKGFSQDGILNCLIRAGEDDAYFERRVDDLMLWPYRLMLAALQEAWHSARDDGVRLPHTTLEIGTLSHRVGATALLDVSYGLNEPLPMSFWASQTSSQLPWLYAAQASARSSETTTGQAVYDELACAIRASYWRYRQILGIIYSQPE
jgi:hypothetical protein